MISTSMMWVLIGFYLLVAAVSAFETNYPRAVYWIGAAIITSSVLWMTTYRL